MFCAYCGKKMTSARKCQSCGKANEPLRSFTRLDAELTSPPSPSSPAPATGADTNTELVAMQNRRLQEANKNQAKRLMIVIAFLIAAVIAAVIFAVMAFVPKDAPQNKNVLYQSEEEFNLSEEGARAYLNPYVREFAERKTATFNGERVNGIKSIRLIHPDDGDKKGRLVKVGEEYIFIPNPEDMLSKAVNGKENSEPSASPSASPDSTDMPRQGDSSDEAQNQNGDSSDSSDDGGDKDDENRADSSRNNIMDEINENKDNVADYIQNKVSQN